MALIDYKKAHDMIPQSWILHCLKMYKIPDQILQFIEKTIQNWRVELTAGGQSLTNEKIQRGIFQGDALSPLLFVIAMMPLYHILKKCAAGYKLSKSQEKINHLMYMDDIKRFVKNENEVETLIQTVRIYSQDIGMEYGIEKCAMLVMNCGKRHITEGVELPNQVVIRTLGKKETLKNVGILEADIIEQQEKKEKIKKRGGTRKLLETKLYSKNLVKEINTWVALLVRYSGPFLMWTKEELKQMDQRTRKLMTIHKALHPRDGFDRLYVSRKEEGRRLANIEDSVDTSIQRLEDYIEKRGGRLVTATRNNTNDTRTSRTTKTRKSGKKNNYNNYNSHARKPGRS